MLKADFLYKHDRVAFTKYVRKHYMIYWYMKNRQNKRGKPYLYNIEEHNDYLNWCRLNPRQFGTRGKERIGYSMGMINKYGLERANILMSTARKVKYNAWTDDSLQININGNLQKGKARLLIPNLIKNDKTTIISFD